MIFDALSDVASPMSVSFREPLKYRTTFQKSAQNHEKSMFVKLTKDHSGDVQESLEMPWSVSKCSRMILDEFRRSLFLMIVVAFSMCTLEEESASHPPPSTRGSAPSTQIAKKSMFVKSTKDHSGDV